VTTMPGKDFLIAVVGNCASGKTTLVENLRRRGYKAVSVPQEHSEVRRLWRFKQPDLLVMLSCTHATAKKRRPDMPWTEKQFAVQRRRLRYAEEECDLFLPTDGLSREEVAARVVELAENKAKESRL